MQWLAACLPSYPNQSCIILTVCHSYTFFQPIAGGYGDIEAFGGEHEAGYQEVAPMPFGGDGVEGSGYMEVTPGGDDMHESGYMMVQPDDIEL